MGTVPEGDCPSRGESLSQGVEIRDDVAGAGVGDVHVGHAVPGSICCGWRMQRAMPSGVFRTWPARYMREAVSSATA
jgi:hypothetical protein